MMVNNNTLLNLIKLAKPLRKFILPSEWATIKRYLPSSVTKKPGRFKWENSPYFKELIDNFSPSSPIQQTILQKSTQIGATQAILETIIGYIIDIFQRAMLYVTADKELAQVNMETRIDLMIEHSGLANKIKPSTYKKGNKTTGDTKSKKEFENGSLQALGAQNPNKARQHSVPILLCDEVDSWPLQSRHGDLIELFESRTDAFDNDKKILWLSSPLNAGTSHIEKLVETGDKRYYEVPCPHCGTMQALFFRGSLINNKYVDDKVYNLIFETDDNGFLIPGSTFYKCRHCEDKIYDYQKFKMVNNGIWRPTKKPSSPVIRSYKINALYNVLKGWDSIALSFLKAKKDPKKLQTFVNNVLAETWVETINKVDAKKIFNEKRREYETLTIPNKAAIADGNGRILQITCSVDVNKKNTWLAVQILGHCLNGQTYRIAKGAIHGDIEANGSAWHALQEIVDYKYVSDDDIEYQLAITVVDCGYKREAVFWFCNKNSFVIPIRGVEKISGTKKHHIVMIDGIKVFNIDTRYYKIKLFENLSLSWSGRPQLQQNNFTNFPDDQYNGGFEKLGLYETFGISISGNGYDETYFKTYESEVPIIVEGPDGKKFIKGFKKKTHNNHFFDTEVYNLSAIDIYNRLICDFEEIPRMDKHSMMNRFSIYIEEYNEPLLLQEFPI